MIVIAMCVFVSLALFVYALRLIVRAHEKPPMDIRTESRRSQAEYDFNRSCAALRRQSRFYMLAAGITMVVSLLLVVVAAMDDSGN